MYVRSRFAELLKLYILYAKETKTDICIVYYIFQVGATTVAKVLILCINFSNNHFYTYIELGCSESFEAIRNIKCKKLSYVNLKPSSLTILERTSAHSLLK